MGKYIFGFALSYCVIYILLHYLYHKNKINKRVVCEKKLNNKGHVLSEEWSGYGTYFFHLCVY